MSVESMTSLNLSGQVMDACTKKKESTISKVTKAFGIWIFPFYSLNGASSRKALSFWIHFNQKLFQLQILTFLLNCPRAKYKSTNSPNRRRHRPRIWLKMEPFHGEIFTIRPNRHRRSNDLKIGLKLSSGQTAPDPKIGVKSVHLALKTPEHPNSKVFLIR